MDLDFNTMSYTTKQITLDAEILNIDCRVDVLLGMMEEVKSDPKKMIKKINN